MIAASAPGSRPRLAVGLLACQAALAAVATIVGVYLAVSTATDIRDTGTASLSGVTVSGCTLLAICASVVTSMLVLASVGLRRSMALARWVGLGLQVSFAVALATTIRGWLVAPTGALVWAAMSVLTACTAVSIWPCDAARPGRPQDLLTG